ncbi:MAG: DUF3299 domain-containing protein [Pseudomonadota bacterium]
MRYSTALLAGLLLISCSDTEADPDYLSAIDTVNVTAQAQTVANREETSTQTDGTLVERGVTQLAWEDLMPEGEEERLEELYEAFYREFEARLMAQQSNLSSTLSNDQDSNSELALSMIAEGSDMDTMEQIGTFNVVEELDGMKIRLPGYIVPLDFSAKAEHKEFLLVPYFGACLHSPPPPPNQIVFVTAEPAAKIPDIYDPVWLEGTLSTGRFDSELGNSAYELSLSLLEPYEW